MALLAPAHGTAWSGAEQARLALAAAAGDHQAFACLVQQLTPALHRYLVATGTRDQDAEDIIQEAFLRAYQAIGDFDPRWAFSTWLYTIAHRLRLNRVASQRPQVALEAVADACAPAAPESGETDDHAPVWALARQILPERLAQALWLRYGEDLELEAIARILGTNAVNIRVMLHRARTRLARHLRQTTPAPERP